MVDCKKRCHLESIMSMYDSLFWIKLAD